jgi:hypothetical protein
MHHFTFHSRTFKCECLLDCCMLFGNVISYINFLSVDKWYYFEKLIFFMLDRFLKMDSILNYSVDSFFKRYYLDR